MNSATNQIEITVAATEPEPGESNLLSNDQLALVAGGQCITNSI